MGPPGSDLTASLRSARSYRKWQAEAGESRPVEGEVTSVWRAQVRSWVASLGI